MLQDIVNKFRWWKMIATAYKMIKLEDHVQQDDHDVCP